MKKMIVFLMAAVMLAAMLTGCAGPDVPNTPSAEPTAAVTATPAAAESPAAETDTDAENDAAGIGTEAEASATPAA